MVDAMHFFAMPLPLRCAVHSAVGAALPTLSKRSLRALGQEPSISLPSMPDGVECAEKTDKRASVFRAITRTLTVRVWLA
jgi:hypothetical protein